MKKPRLITKIRNVPAARPGSDRGKYTLQKAATGPAPRLAAARRQLRSIARIEP
jgi:hypothetical protein